MTKQPVFSTRRFAPLSFPGGARLCALCAACAGLLLCVPAVAEQQLGDPSNACSFDLDTAGETISVKTLATPVALTVRQGETITATAQGRLIPAVLVESAATTGVYPWTPDAGGVWTLENPGAGTAHVSVRYSLFGTQGSGTTADPMKIVDDEELADLVSDGAAGAGTVFLLKGTASLGDLVPPSGFAVEDLGGRYRLQASGTAGQLFASYPGAFPLDTRQPGPDRIATRRDVVQIAHSGDGWKREVASATSALAVTTPSGTSTNFPALSGDGAVSLRLNESGLWSVALSPSSSQALAGTITVGEPATVLSVGGTAPSDAARFNATEMNRDGDYPISVEPGDIGGRKMLFLGNSITLHSPRADLGWTNRCGMAASAPEKDYVHLVAAAVAAADGQAPNLFIRNIADFETGGYRGDYTAALTDEIAFAPDIVVIAVGENVPNFSSPADKAAYGDALAALGRRFLAAGASKVVYRAPWWRNTDKADETYRAADAVGAIYVDAADIGDDRSNWAVGQFDHSGVAAHPGDAGMRGLADQIIEALAL